MTKAREKNEALPLPNLRLRQLVRFRINGVERVGVYLGDITGRSPGRTRSRARVSYTLEESNRKRSATVNKRKMQPV